MSGDRATGIRLKGGDTVAASVVVSGLGLPQTVLRLMRTVKVNERITHRLKNIHYDRGQLFWANVALHEPPRYAAADTNPEVGPQPRLLWGPKDPDYLATRYQPEIYLKGHPDRVYAFTSCDTLWDPSRAPAGNTSSASRSLPRRAAYSAAASGTISRRLSRRSCLNSGATTRQT